MSNLFNRVVGLVVASLIVAPWLSLVSAPGTAATQFNSQRQRAIPLEYSPVFSDFDGDDKVDIAELSSNGRYKNIQVNFSNSPLKSLSFDTGVADRGRLISGDIDSDNDEDLIWVSQNQPKKLIYWLGDGLGNFALAKEPPPDTQKVDALLGKDFESELSEGAGVFDLSVALMPSDAAELELPKQPAIYFAPSVLPERKEERTAPAPFLSVLSRRGPPARLS